MGGRGGQAILIQSFSRPAVTVDGFIFLSQAVNHLMYATYFTRSVTVINTNFNAEGYLSYFRLTPNDRHQSSFKSPFRKRGIAGQPRPVTLLAARE